MKSPSRLRWYAAGIVAGCGVAAAAVAFLYATFASAGDVKALERRTTRASEDIARIEAMHKADSDRLERMENKIDRLLIGSRNR